MTEHLERLPNNTSRDDQIRAYIETESLQVTPGVELCVPGTKLSVVIPAFNEERSILETLRSLDQSSVPIETVVVDNDSQDNTVDIVNDFSQSSKYPITVLTASQKGPVYARKRGCDEVVAQYMHKGLRAERFLAMTDADTIIPSDWAEQILRLGEDENPAAIGGAFRYSAELDKIIENRLGIPNYFYANSRYAYLSAKLGLSVVNTYGPNTAIEILPYVQIGGSRQPIDDQGNKVKGSDTRYGNEVRKLGQTVALNPVMPVTSARREIYSLANKLNQAEISSFQGWLDIRDNDHELLSRVVEFLDRDKLLLHRRERLISFTSKWIILSILDARVTDEAIVKLLGYENPLCVALREGDDVSPDEAMRLAIDHCDNIFEAVIRSDGLN